MPKGTCASAGTALSPRRRHSCHGAFFAFAGQCGTSLGTAIRRVVRAPHRARQGCVPDCSGPHGAHVPAERRQQRRWHCFLWEGRAVGGGQLRASPGGLRGVGGKATGPGLRPRPVLLCRWTSLTKRKREKKIPKNVKTVTKVIENPVQCLLLSTAVCLPWWPLKRTSRYQEEGSQRACAL